MSNSLLRSAVADAEARGKRNVPRFLLVLQVLSVVALCVSLRAQTVPSPSAKISKAASDSCARKVKELQVYASSASPRKQQKTSLSEEEVNSYLAFELKPNYHLSLQNLVLTFEEKRLSGTASIDFDRLSMNSTKFLNKLIAKLLSGVHTLSANGKLITSAGRANFELEEARFDSSVLPNFLVEEIITAVGRKQRPPFDPMQPSKMPYSIDKVDVHRGYITVYQ